MTTEDIQHADAEVAAAVFKALGHPIRLKIVRFLQEGDARAVSDIVKAVEAEQSVQ